MVLYRLSDGKRFVVEHVDGVEYLATGGYSREKPVAKAEKEKRADLKKEVK